MNPSVDYEGLWSMYDWSQPVGTGYNKVKWYLLVKLQVIDAKLGDSGTAE